MQHKSIGWFDNSYLRLHTKVVLDAFIWIGLMRTGTSGNIVHMSAHAILKWPFCSKIDFFTFWPALIVKRLRIDSRIRGKKD